MYRSAAERSCKNKIIYAPCDVKPFPKAEKFQDADVLIIGNTIVGDILKDGFFYYTFRGRLGKAI